MNIDICNALSGYIQTLYSLNQKLIKLCGTDIIDKYEFSHVEVLNIIQGIPRMIPYEYNKKSKKLELQDRNGLLEYKENISYLEQDYNNILNKNYEFLNNIRKIKNKYEHKMHGVKRKSSGSGTTSFFDFVFEVYSEEKKGFEDVSIVAEEFIKLFKMLNTLFSKMVKEIEKYSYESGKQQYTYYRRLNRFDFEEFNKLYESDLLRIFGKLMLEF